MLPKWRVDAALGKVEPYKKYPFLLLFPFSSKEPY